MNISIELLVSLKIPDVTALTARRTLRHAMGHADRLADLTRADWWRIEVIADDVAAALDLGRELAEETNCFVNPNKHVYEVVESLTLPPAAEGITLVAVLTGFEGDPSAELTAQALRGRLGYADRVVALERGTLWTLYLREADPKRARELAEAMCVSTDVEHGLLANPHSMWWRWVGEGVAEGV